MTWMCTGTPRHHTARAQIAGREHNAEGMLKAGVPEE